MPRGFQGESVEQEARGGSRAAVERGRTAASRSFQTSPTEDSSRFQQGSRDTEGQSSFDLGNTTPEALTYDQFMTATGRTATNPYGDQGFFSRVFGLDPSKIDYTNNFGQNPAKSRGIMSALNSRAYNAYLNPVDLSTGFVNPMLDEGSLTRFGRVESDPNLRQGVGGFGLPAIISKLFDRSDLVVPGQPASDARRQDIGIFDFETPRNMDELVSSALQERAPRSIAGLTDIEIFEPFTTDDERMTEDAVRYETVSQFPPSAGFIRPDDAAMPTVAEILAAEPMVTERPSAAVPGYVDPVIDPDTGLVVEGGNRLPTGPKVIQEIPGGDPGSASITVNPQTQSPSYVAPDQPVDLLSDILAPDGSILPGVMDAISSGEPQPQVDPRTGRIPGTTGTFDFGGGTSANVTSFTPQDIARMNKRAQDIDALRFQYIQQGMPPALAFARARSQVGQ